jgi:hypothetical protein
MPMIGGWCESLFRSAIVIEEAETFPLVSMRCGSSSFEQAARAINAQMANAIFFIFLL